MLLLYEKRKRHEKHYSCSRAVAQPQLLSHCNLWNVIVERTILLGHRIYGSLQRMQQKANTIFCLAVMSKRCTCAQATLRAPSWSGCLQQRALPTLAGPLSRPSLLPLRARRKRNRVLLCAVAATARGTLSQNPKSPILRRTGKAAFRSLVLPPRCCHCSST